MKKLLAVATIAVIGYKVVKKIKERKDNNIVEEKVEVNEEITIDNDEENIEVEDIEIVEGEKEEIKVFDRIKRIVKAPIKLVVKVCGFICGLLIKVNKKIDNADRTWCKIQLGEPVNLRYHLKFYTGLVYMIIMYIIIICNRLMMLALGLICNLLNKLI